MITTKITCDICNKDCTKDSEGIMITIQAMNGQPVNTGQLCGKHGQQFIRALEKWLRAKISEEEEGK